MHVNDKKEKYMEFLKRFFKIEENNTSVRLEIYTGLISFLAISYILAVNPSILGYAGMDAGGVFYATCWCESALILSFSELMEDPKIREDLLSENNGSSVKE